MDKYCKRKQALPSHFYIIKKYLFSYARDLEKLLPLWKARTLHHHSSKFNRLPSLKTIGGAEQWIRDIRVMYPFDFGKEDLSEEVKKHFEKRMSRDESNLNRKKILLTSTQFKETFECNEVYDEVLEQVKETRRFLDSLVLEKFAKLNCLKVMEKLPLEIWEKILQTC